MLETESSSSMNVLNDGVVPTLTSSYGKGPGPGGGDGRPMVYGFDPGASRDVGELFLEEQSKTLSNGSCPGHHNGIVKENEMEKKYVVRRLCPDECAALQGYPKDWVNIGEWTDSKGKKHKDSDSPKYKAYGNSIAVPAWGFIINGIEAELRKDGVKTPKMGSLFDGIGGFPLLWEHFGGKAVWASEIEEFCIAVTKIRFPEEVEE